MAVGFQLSLWQQSKLMSPRGESPLSRDCCMRDAGRAGGSHLRSIFSYMFFLSASIPHNMQATQKAVLSPAYAMQVCEPLPFPQPSLILPQNCKSVFYYNPGRRESARQTHAGTT